MADLAIDICSWQHADETAVLLRMHVLHACTVKTALEHSTMQLTSPHLRQQQHKYKHHLEPKGRALLDKQRSISSRSCTAATRTASVSQSDHSRIWSPRSSAPGSVPAAPMLAVRACSSRHAVCNVRATDDQRRSRVHGLHRTMLQTCNASRRQAIVQNNAKCGQCLEAEARA